MLNLVARDLSYAKQRKHVQAISQVLETRGILKITLNFPDEASKYLRDLMYSLHENHGHGLPISHSASRGWFWDVRPSSSTFQTQNHQARSETMENFPWHTDCSYEASPPRFFGLQVLQPDRHGGGTLSLTNVEELIRALSPTSVAALLKPHYRIITPQEFIKGSGDACHIIGSIIAANKTGQATMMRFREDITTPLSVEAHDALKELKQTLLGMEMQRKVTNLTPEFLPKGSIVLTDNYRWLHARSQVRDPKRHLRRVRWDAAAFPAAIR